MAKTKVHQNLINHISLVLDESSSMYPVRRDLVEVADGLVKYLATRSKELDQETRITVYTFSSFVECIVYDMDVLRLPSMSTFYEPNGMTALIDATLQSCADLLLTPQKYGDHAFLTFVLTDGQENASHGSTKALNARLTLLPDNWTVAVLVPNQTGIFEAKKFGFPADNIAVWDATTAQGVAEGGRRIQQATENFMVSRASGVRSTRTLFSTGIDVVNKGTIKSAGLKPISKGAYVVLDVKRDRAIRETVEDAGFTYIKGNAYYQLTKTETIQAYKGIAIRNRHSGRYHTGANARDLLGLGGNDVRVKPDHNPEYDIFVQSTSVNRRLLAGTRLLLLK